MSNLALFDFDGTITTADTFTPFIRYAVSPKRLEALACYRDDVEIQAYVSSAIHDLNTKADTLDCQIRALKNKLHQFKDKENKLIETLSTMSATAGATWLQGKLTELNTEKESIAAAAAKLERERSALSKNQPTVKDIKKTLEYAFTNFKTATSSFQRNLFRQLFNKIEVFEKNQVRLYWRFTECGFGGTRFALETREGPYLDEFITASLALVA